MCIPRNVDVIRNLILVHVLERSVLVRPIRRPGIGAERDGPVLLLLLDVRKDQLVPDNAPFRASVFTFRELTVEPVLLARAHDAPAGVVVDHLNVVSVVAYYR